MRSALVFGANSQAGSYMCELLLSKDYEVVGTIRSHLLGENVKQVKGLTVLRAADVTERSNVRALLKYRSFDEVYNFTGKMFAPASWDEPMGYLEVNGIAVLHMLDTLRGMAVKFFNAGSAGVFGPSSIRKNPLEVLNKSSARNPRTPHDYAKLLAENAVASYRDKYNMFACTGIFFNMESPRRERTFFANKVASEVVRMALEKEKFGDIRAWADCGGRLKLGKLVAKRDWGWTPEYVEAAWMMLQSDTPVDYVIGTGESHSCYDFVLEGLKCAGLSDQSLEHYTEFIPAEGNEPSDVLACDPSSIRRVLGWRATTRFSGVVKNLVDAEMKRQRDESNSSR